MSIEIPIGVYLEKDRRNVNGIGESTFFHIPIKNNSLLKHAVGCGAYISRCLKLEQLIHDRGTISGDLKWTGVSIPHVKLYKKTNTVSNFTRSVAAAFIPDKLPKPVDNPPKKGYLYLVGDFMGYPQKVFEEGEYVLEYTIVSDNFPEIRACFKLKIGDTPNDCTMQRVADTAIDDLIFSTTLD